jgi:hypothetical protein
MEAINVDQQDELPTYMRDDVKWVETKNDGILLFKNVSFNVRETDKAEVNQNEYEHNQDNIIVDFEADTAKYEAEMKYFHTIENKFVTVVTKHENEQGEFTELTVKYIDEEETFTIKAADVNNLIDSLPIKARILTKTGNKISLNVAIRLDEDMKTGLNKIFASIGQKASKFKIFHGKELLSKDMRLDRLYKLDQVLEFF